MTATTAAYEPANNSNEDHHHHYYFPKKQIAYVVVLLLVLVMLGNNGTGDEQQYSVFEAVQQHEPSVRIFRALSEVVLLLLCAAASVAVYTRFLGADVTADLLFQPPASAQQQLQSSGLWPSSYLRETNNDDDDDDEKLAKKQDGDIELQSVTTGSTPKEGDGEEKEAEVSEQQQDIHDDDEEEEEAPPPPLTIPSPIKLVTGALDFLVWILIALVFYTLASVQAGSSSNYDNENNDDDDDANKIVRVLSRIAAPTFALLLFVFAVFKAVYPWNQQRSSLVQVVGYTIGAPGFAVTFRDGMIGDVLTSMVRPMQDIAFTVFYILFGLRGWWSSQYYYYLAEDASQTQRQFIEPEQQQELHDNNVLANSFLDAADASVPAMEKSWIVHTVVLPACMISPLWWRFLQNMRQTHDTQQRWPYLANAFKYFIAAQVAMVGVYHPHLKQSAVWLTSFVVATLYQVWYDVVLDWGLLARNPHTGRWQLRSQRLYPRKSMYWALAVINLVLRFCWTLSFVPMRYLSAAGVLTDNFTGDAWASILAPTIASAEIIRRTLWGFLRVEWEAIKVRGEPEEGSDDEDEDGLKMTPMNGGGSAALRRFRIPLLTSDMSSMNNVQILTELGLYTTVFAILGLLAAAHRETL